MAKMLGHGVYSMAEAASLTGLRPGRVSEWFGRRRRRTGVFKGDYREVKGDRALSFHDLIDVLVAGKLRDEGVSLETIRRVYTQLAESEGEHPFCRNVLLTDGDAIFMRELEEDRLFDVERRQQVFANVLLPYLRQIEYDEETRLALRWHVDDGVVVDPALSFGKPILDSSAFETSALATAYFANGEDAELVAEWYGCSPEDVVRAVRFEHRVAA